MTIQRDALVRLPLRVIVAASVAAVGLSACETSPPSAGSSTNLTEVAQQPAQQCGPSGWVVTRSDGTVVAVHGPITMEFADGEKPIVLKAGETWRPEVVPAAPSP